MFTKPIPLPLVRMHWDHEPGTRRTVPPTRCCRHLAGSAFLRSLCRQDAGSTFGFMKRLFSFFRMHWDHEPNPDPSQEGTCGRGRTPPLLLGGVGGGSAFNERTTHNGQLTP